MNNSESKFTVTYGDIVYEKSFYAFNGLDTCNIAKLIIKVDPEGVIRKSNEYKGFDAVIPGKIQLLTANDDGKLRVAVEVDKAGRFLSWNQIWCVTQNPSGIPLMLVCNTNEQGAGSSINLRRSRGTFHLPNSVIKNDTIFKISWYAHDSQSYKETINIQGKVNEDVSIGIIPSELNFNFLQKNSEQKTCFKFSSNQTLYADNIASLNNEALVFKSPIVLPSINKLKSLETKPYKLGTIIYVEENDSIMAYTKKGWVIIG